MRFITLLAFLVAAAFGAVSKISMPTDYSSVTNGTRANLKANFDETQTKFNPAADSIDEVRGRMSGYSGNFTLSSLDNLNLRLDTDGSLSGILAVLNGATSDTLFRVKEDSTWKAWGAGVGTKIALSDSILASTARVTGLTASRILATNADKTLASVSDLTSWIAGTSNQVTATSDGDGSLTLSIPNGFTLPSASPTFTGLTLSGNATIGGTLGVTGVATFTAAPVFSAFSNRIPFMNVSGVLSSHSDMAYDGTTITWGNGNTINRATGNLSLSYLSSGRIPVVSTSGLITQDNLYWDATNDRLGIGSGASSPSATLSVISSNVGGGIQATIFNSDNTNGASHGRIVVASGGSSAGDALTTYSNQVIEWSMGLDNSDGDAFVITPASTLGGATNGLRISTAGAVTIPGTLGVTGAISNPTLSGTITTPLTASLPVFTNGSSQLTTNAVTGTGNVMMSASPTTTGTLTGAAANFSGAVSTGALTATSATLGGGEAFTYGDTSFTLTATGMTTSPTGTAYATRIGRFVQINIPYIAGTSNSTSFWLTGFPASWCPTTSTTVSIPYGQNSGTSIDASNGLFADLISGGNLILYYAGSSTGWASSGTKAIGSFGYAISITYNLQ